MNRKDKYVDKNLWKKTVQEQKRRYYGKTAFMPKKSWNPEDELRVLEHKIPDSELSVLIGHSVGSIQTKRSKLKREGSKYEK